MPHCYQQASLQHDVSQRSVNPKASTTHSSMKQIQRSLGNQALQRRYAPISVQPKLTVNKPGDRYEQEADRVADEVMRMPDTQVQRKCACGGDAGPNGECKTCEARRLALQRKEAGYDSENEAPPSVHEVLSRPGQPLDMSTRTFMESRFGADFSSVRVHIDDEAAKSAHDLNARAYTVGYNIAFGAGEYAPGAGEGNRLLAHELTHVVQQSGIEEKSAQLGISSNNGTGLSRFPAPVSFGINTPGLSLMPPVIKEGYDGKSYTAIKNNWGLSSWERHWQIYDAEDKLLYESYYTWPQPTLYIQKDVIAKGKAGKGITPWSVWHEVTETTVPFGGSDRDNFPYTHTKFYVYETWKDFMADPNAKLSDIKQEERLNEEPNKPTLLESPIVTSAGSVIDYGSVVAMHEAYLREIYDKSAKGITESAKELVNKGLPQGDAAKWANEARNVLKDRIRTDGNPILKKVFESRNLNIYKNKLGPTYEQLFQKYAKQGFSPEEINKKIIGSSGKANFKVNRWSGRLKVAGRIMLFIDIALAGVRVYLAPEGERTKAALEEVARIGGALALGAAGAEAGATTGAAVGALFAGVGAAPGAIIGGIIGGVGGAIFGGWLGQTAVEKLYEMLPPSDCVFEGDFNLEDR